MNKTVNHSDRGFSLLELSAVLVIVALIIGGIVTGKSLIHGAGLRAVTNEFTEYKSAMTTFEDKYFALPGDMPNATDYWGSAGAGGDLAAGCSTLEGIGSQTCNGDGDGIITPIEGLKGWQHLANAGIISGTYSGVFNEGSTTNGVRSPGENVPESGFRTGLGWEMTFYVDENDSTIQIGTFVEGNFWDINFKQEGYLSFGGRNSADAEISMHYRSLTTEEAWTIDLKIDDGRPGTGIVKTWGTGKCIDLNHGGGSPSSRIRSLYNVNDTLVKYCALVMKY